MFNTGKDIDVLCNQINEDLQAIQEWLNCDKLSLNVLKTHYMIFLPRNKIVNDIEIKIYGTRIQRVYVTKFLGVQIDAHLTWKSHIDYTCSKLSKCVGILAKARKKLSKSSLINLYYSFAYPYLIYCNHVWGHNYTTSLEKLHLVQKKLVRIVTCSPFRAHTEPLIVANRILNVYDISAYVTGTLMYEYMCGDAPSSLHDFFQTNSDVHTHDTRFSNHIHVPYGRLDIRRFGFKISGGNLWNSLPDMLKKCNTIHLFKRNFRNYLFDKKRNA